MKFIDKLLGADFLQPFLNWAYGLNALEIRIVIIITLLLILLLAYRLFGIPVTVALIAIFFIVYIIWENHTFDYLEKQEKNANERMRLYQDEIDKSGPSEEHQE